MSLMAEPASRASAILIAALACLLSVLVNWRGDPARGASLAVSMPSDERTSLLWPGSFDVIDSQDHTSIRFVAAERRYVAVVSSTGFAVHDTGGSADRTHVQFAGAQSGVVADTGDEIAPRLHLFGGPDGVDALARYDAVRFPSVYPGIDVLYRVAGGQLEFDFIVAAGATPDVILLGAAHGSRFSIPDHSGSVVVSSGAARYSIKRPVAYQWVNGGRRDVHVEWRATTESLQFGLGSYDPSLELIIDPLVATMSTFVGSDTDFRSEYDEVRSITVDSDGSTYLAGATSFNYQFGQDAGLPSTTGSLKILHPAGDGVSCNGPCGYVLKLNSQRQLVYSALLFGLEIADLAVDGQGGIYLAGDFTHVSTETFPWTSSLRNEEEDEPASWLGSFVAKIHAGGSALSYAYKFPAFNPDSGEPAAAAIAVDDEGGAYVVGATNGNRLPMSSGALRSVHPAEPVFDIDAYLLKIRPDGAGVEFGTYLGGSGDDEAMDVIINHQGRPVVVGRSASDDFAGLGARPAGEADAFVVEVAENASGILRGRFLGGTSGDGASSIALSGPDGYLIGGSTQSEDFPVSNGVIQPALLGEIDGFVARLDQGLQTLYSTYFGGSFHDWIAGVASDASGNAYVAGVSFSSDMLTTSDGFQAMTTAVSTDVLGSAGAQFYKFGSDFHGIPREGYIGVLAPDGRTLTYGSYLSGYYSLPRNFEVLTSSRSIARHADGRLAVGGYTSADSFPTTDGVMRSRYGGWSEGYLIELAPSSLHVTTETLLPRVEVDGRPYSLQLRAAGGQPPYAWQVAGFRLPEGLSLSASGLISGAVTDPVEFGAYQLTVKVSDAAGHVAYKSLLLPPIYDGWPVCEAGTCRFRIDVVSHQGLPGYPEPIPVRSIPPYTTVVTGTLPTGISLDSANGGFVGWATTPGRFVYTFTTTDARGKSAALTWDVTVYDSTSPSPSPPPEPDKSSGGGALGLAGLACLAGMLGVAVRRRLRMWAVRRRQLAAFALSRGRPPRSRQPARRGTGSVPPPPFSTHSHPRRKHRGLRP